MNKRQISTVFAMGSVAALAACGGGSGDNVFTSFAALPDTGVTQMTGQAITADFDGNGTGIDLSNEQGPSDATALITTENGEIVAFSVQGPGSSISFDTRTGTGDTIEVTTDGYIEASNSNETLTAIFADPESKGFDYQTFGGWANGAVENGGSVAAVSGSFGFASLGARTPSGSMPSGTSATYEGQSVGVLTSRTFAPDNGIATADMKIKTSDFVTLEFETTGTILNSFDGTFVNAPAGALTLNGTATVTGSGFEGTLTSTYSGTFSGGFYGPNAEEVGGTFSTSRGANANYVGSFGGVRQ